MTDVVETALQRALVVAAGLPVVADTRGGADTECRVQLERAPPVMQHELDEVRQRHLQVRRERRTLVLAAHVKTKQFIAP